jgi:hypothetical protein
MSDLQRASVVEWLLGNAMSLRYEEKKAEYQAVVEKKKSDNLAETLLRNVNSESLEEEAQVIGCYF